MVLVAGFAAYGLAFGTVCSYGVYTPTWQRHFNASTREATAIASTAYALIPLSGPLAALSYRRLGARVSVMGGATLTSLGFLLSYAASYSLVHLITFQAFVGLGFGFQARPFPHEAITQNNHSRVVSQVVSALSVQSEYFAERLHLAMAIVPAGVAVLLLFFPNLFAILSRRFGWENSMLVPPDHLSSSSTSLAHSHLDQISAGLGAVGVLAGAVMRRNEAARPARVSEFCQVSLLRSPSLPLFCASVAAWAGSSITYYRSCSCSDGALRRLETR